ncbi:MAG: hypothetical protein A2Z21_07005 [Candidatus Fraserbacteria bacterium RBG_16_55_9]|uniref:DUF2281 domain-containing protein n=1 Tax=Fraserbacteria sp. (strain RBG_16_55_9) TaxID=1817864 RepID=A0A1F5URM1_FRAXR|nr:MAG: hypothetical protein A2Z21_07005 [Candidatus Fraserbacteria bacterium RBG_16_55_9]
MATKSRYAGELLAELKGLTEEEQAKLVKVIRFLKEEILQEPTCEAEMDKEAILRHAGLLADLSSQERERF